MISHGIQPLMQDLKQAMATGEGAPGQWEDRLSLLHGLSSVAYLLKSMLGMALILTQRSLGNALESKHAV